MDAFRKGLSLKFLVVFVGLTASQFASAQTINAVVRLKEKVSIETLAQNVQDPSSPRFGVYYTPEEIRALVAPSDTDYANALAQLRKEGFAITAESPTHLWVSVTADHKLFETVFSTKITQLSSGLRQGLTVASAPNRLPMIAALIGLDNTRKSHPRLKKPAAVSDSSGGVAQDTIKSAYGLAPIYKSGWSGKGQHIAIATYMGFNIDDVKHFYTVSDLKPGPSVDQVSYNGTPAYDEGSAEETELDAEFSGMIAPGAAIHVFASAENSDAGELQMFTAILDDNRAKIVNYSWGDCEKNLTPAHQAEMAKVFARAVAQGVNVMVASGDSGSDSCQDGSTVADWPSANPNVVSVGGTSFAQNGSAIAETAWTGSGGGISGLWDLPSWQKQLGSPYVKRSYPDVSFNADPYSGQAIWTHQNGTEGWAVIGGTSMAAPQWAGYLALVGEARAAKGKATLGFLDPIIYALSGDERGKFFNDITSGSNGAYKAGKGWDAVTGWGSMQGDSLLNRLVTN